MTVGETVDWAVVTRPPMVGVAMAFHEDVPDPEGLRGVIEAIFVVRDEYAACEVSEAQASVRSEGAATYCARTGRRAHRSVPLYPNRRWSGDLVVAVRPRDRR